MKAEKIERYVAELKSHLWWAGLANPRTLEEIEDHLYELTEEGLKKGLDFEEAQTMALSRFGSIHQVANQFSLERMGWIQRVLLTIGILGGLFFAYVDNLPKFDDTGVLAFTILIFSGLIALFGYRRAWLLALFISLWIPLHEVISFSNYGGLLAVPFALAGAYAGLLMNRFIRKNWWMV